MKIFIYLPLCILLCGFHTSLSAQKAPAYPRKTELVNFADSVRNLERVTEFGIMAGLYNYRGDLTSNNTLPKLSDCSPAVGLFVRRHLWPNLAIRANIMTGKLSGTDLAYPSRGYSFTGSAHEFSGQLEWDIFGKRRYRHCDTTVYVLDNYRQNALVNGFHHKLLPYLFAGGGAILTDVTPTFNMPYAEQAGQLANVQEDLRLSKGLKTNWGILFGGGLNIDLSRKWLLGVEVAAHTAFNDYFDGISKAAGPKYYDWFWTGMVTLSYRLGVHDMDGDGTPDDKDKCPEIPGMGRTHGCPDADNDGIPDKDDACPRVAGIVALSGCPMKDADNDGIQDVDDLCPNVAGLLQFHGCPDTDGDGIEDKLDSCLTVAGLPQFHGCPDTDGDGIEDRYDACPKEKGVWDFYHGCPVRDSDGDGVEDKLDACPKIAGKPEFKGCPDTDNDGVEDALDMCPTKPGKPENRGCPVIEKKDQDKLNLAVKSVKFESGKAILKAESGKILTDIAEIMGKYPEYMLRIEGHTDNVGKPDHNQLLSEQRAKACLDFLAGKGVDSKRVQTAGFGSSKPITDNKTATGKATNRRVEFILYLPEKPATK
jgi:outer membrane protein OmpA-like peptidoglycan-associated protein